MAEEKKEKPAEEKPADDKGRAKESELESIAKGLAVAAVAALAVYGTYKLAKYVNEKLQEYNKPK